MGETKLLWGCGRVAEGSGRVFPEGAARTSVSADQGRGGLPAEEQSLGLGPQDLLL